MGSGTEPGGGGFDTSQPGVRQIQAWIRGQTDLALQLLDGSHLRGVPRWLDGHFLAVVPEGEPHPVLVNRQAIAWIRVLG